MSTDAQNNDRIEALEYLVKKLTLDGKHLAMIAEKFQSAINAVDAAQEKLEPDIPDDGPREAAEQCLQDAQELRSEYWGALQLAIHEFRKRAASADDLPSASTVAPQVSIVICPMCESAERTYWPQEPFSYFRRNEATESWYEVSAASKDVVGVIAAYRLPVPNMSPESTHLENMSTKTENVDMSTAPSLVCGQCGADRLKEDCKGDRARCDIAGIAHSSSAPPTFKPRIVINLSTQTLELRGLNNSLIRHYKIASATNGAGEVKGSECTPRGRHVVRAKIGAGVPVGAVFVGRRPTGEIYSGALANQHQHRDWILTRILWLSGCEPGFNRLGEVDTMQRFIYIHGCPDHVPMGRPSSHGCIRMRNVDVIDLFDLTPAGTLIEIIK